MKKGFFLLNIISVFLLFLTSGVSVCGAGIEQQKKVIQERDREILRLDKKKQATEQDKKELTVKIDMLEKKIRGYEEKIYGLQQATIQNQAQVYHLQEQLDRSKKGFAGRVRQMYLQGRYHYLNTLFQADSGDDFFSFLDWVYKLMKRDRRDIDRYLDKQLKMEKAQQRLSSQLRQLKKEKDNEKRAYTDLQNQLEKVQGTLLHADSHIQELEDQNERSRQELNRLVAGVSQRVRRQEASGKKMAFTSGQACWPVDGARVTSGFGNRYNPVRKVYKKHLGTDFAAPLGTPIRAVWAGEVMDVRPSLGYGYIVMIYHGGGITTLYAHMYGRTVRVKVGDRVRAGQIIAAVGSNGWSTGPHLHLEVRKGGNPVDSMVYF